MTDTKPLSALYIEEANAFSNRLYRTHNSYSGRTIYRGEELPWWYRTATREFEELNRTYERFWRFGGTGQKFYDEQHSAGKYDVLRTLQRDNDSMYDGLVDFHKGLTPYWVREHLPLTRVAEPAVLVEHHPKRGLSYAAAVLFGGSAHYEVERNATLVSHIGNEGGVRHQQLFVNR